LEVEALFELVKDVRNLVQLDASFFELSLGDVEEGVVDFLEHFSNQKDANGGRDHQDDHHSDDNEKTEQYEVNEVLVCGVHRFVEVIPEWQIREWDSVHGILGEIQDLSIVVSVIDSGDVLIHEF
jgi:hypothetical protein